MFLDRKWVASIGQGGEENRRRGSVKVSARLSLSLDNAEWELGIDFDY